MEAVSKLKYILLDDKSAFSHMVRLLIELVVDPIIKWLKETWTPTKFPQQEQLVQFLQNLPLEFPLAREFLYDVVLPGLSSAIDRYDTSWEIVPVNVFLQPWMSTIDRDLLQPMLTKVLTAI
jgi:tuftelin-interacting protein 11